MQLKVKSNKELVKNGTEIEFPGEYGKDVISIYTNDWVTNYQIKLKGRKPFLKFFNREKCFR